MLRRSIMLLSVAAVASAYAGLPGSLPRWARPGLYSPRMAVAGSLCGTEGISRRAVLPMVGAALALQLPPQRAVARGYDKGQPMPSSQEQGSWGTQMGKFLEQGDGLDDVRRDIVEMLKADRTLGASLVRLAFHSSGTYDSISKTGGSARGTLRFKDELAHEANAGLEKIVPILEPLKKKHATISYADLYTLAGAVSVEALGGPHIPWKSGRVDSLNPKDVTVDGRLPDPDKDLKVGSTAKTMSHLRMVFGRMGFSDQEIVALSGAHNLGKCHYQDSGYDGVWSETPWKFDNSYFNILVQPLAMTRDDEPDWTPVTLPNGKIQYEDPNHVYIMLPSDLALLQVPFSCFSDNGSVLAPARWLPAPSHVLVMR